jgi:putative membrane protein
MTSRQRWPRKVYGSGSEPDPRFTLANERTFLAWVRTALALLAAGVALDAVVRDIDPSMRKTLAAVLILLGVVTSGTAYARWMRSERAMRHSQPLPALHMAAVLGYGTAVLGVAVLVLVVGRA